MCRLIFFQKDPVYEYYIGIPIVLVCFFDVGIAIRTVFMPMKNHEGSLPLLVRKLVGLAGALPMMALAAIVFSHHRQGSVSIDIARCRPEI